MIKKRGVKRPQRFEDGASDESIDEVISISSRFLSPPKFPKVLDGNATPSTSSYAISIDQQNEEKSGGIPQTMIGQVVHASIEARNYEWGNQNEDGLSSLPIMANEIQVETSQDITDVNDCPKCGCSDSRIEEYLKVLTKEVILLKQEVREKDTRTLLQGTANAGIHQPEEYPNELPKFPLKTMEEVDQMEGYISMNRDCINILKKHVAYTGASHQEEAVRETVKKMLSIPVAMQMNWAGRVKRSFKNLHLCTVLLESVKMNTHFIYQDKAVEAATKNWLKYAADLDGGRNRRKAKNIVVN